MFASSISKRQLRLLTFAGALGFALSMANEATAEISVAKGDGYEVFVDGRLGGYLSWVYGDGFPQPVTAINENGVPQTLYQATGGGFIVKSEEPVIDDPALAEGQRLEGQGTVNSMRLRSGFIGNVFGFGVRTPVTDTTTATAYLQLWSFVESTNRDKSTPNDADFRMGYGKLEGPWGHFIAGRARALFSRGATDINFNYAHRYGVGYPAAIDNRGPTAGMVGFGVLGSGWGGTLQYGTPSLAGFQLTVGVLDPIQLQASGFDRTKYARPEAELRYKLQFGANGLVELFANGGVQKVYRSGYCPPKDDVNSGFCDTTAGGMGYGARFEYSVFRVGVAGHFGTGLGLTRAMEVSDASTDKSGRLRDSDGYYLQTQFVLGDFDLFTGAGIARVFLNDYDKERVPNPVDPTTTILRDSVIKNQIGINAGVVYHLSPSVHFSLDYHRAEANWYLGENQVLHATNGGMTLTW